MVLQGLHANGLRQAAIIDEAFAVSAIRE